MFDKYPYKTKFKALLVVFSMLAVAAYKRSFNPLFDVIKEHRELLEKEDKLSKGSGDLQKLTAEIAAMDKVIGKTGLDKEKVQQDILGFIAKHPSVSVYNMEPIHVFSDESHTAYTYEVDITGNLNDLLVLSYSFEKSWNYSRIVSMNFYTSKKERKIDILHLKLIFQNYENNN